MAWRPPCDGSAQIWSLLCRYSVSVKLYAQGGITHDSHLIGDGGEAAEAHELGHVDADGAGAGQRQESERRHVPVVVEHPGRADVAVQEGAQQHQRPPLQPKQAAAESLQLSHHLVLHLTGVGAVSVCMHSGPERGSAASAYILRHITHHGSHSMRMSVGSDCSLTPPDSAAAKCGDTGNHSFA